MSRKERPGKLREMQSKSGREREHSLTKSLPRHYLPTIKNARCACTGKDLTKTLNSELLNLRLDITKPLSSLKWITRLIMKLNSPKKLKILRIVYKKK